MKSKKRGKNISRVEIQNISPSGIWIFVNEKEYFLDYHHFPWFEDAQISEVFDVELLHENHLHWPKLDVDLELESLKNTEEYPLVYS